MEQDQFHNKTVSVFSTQGVWLTKPDRKLSIFCGKQTNMTPVRCLEKDLNKGVLYAVRDNISDFGYIYLQNCRADIFSVTCMRINKRIALMVIGIYINQLFSPRARSIPQNKSSNIYVFPYEMGLSAYTFLKRYGVVDTSNNILNVQHASSQD